MASKIWKTFNFFDSSTFKLSSEQYLADGSQITSVCSGIRHVFFGLSNGTICALSSKYIPIATWRAHSSSPITHMKFLESSTSLVTVSEDLIAPPEMKVWLLKGADKKGLQAQLQSTLRISSQRIFPMTCFSVTQDLSEVAAAFANGVVVLVRGDLIHDRGTRQRVIHESEEPITGIQFAEEASSSVLYVTTTERVMTIKTSIRGQIPSPRILETAGCALGCLALDKSSGNILVARNDAIYYYGSDGRGPCYAYEGPKSQIHSFGSYVLLLLPPPQNSSNSTSGVVSSLRNIVGSKRENFFEVNSLAILDTELQFIAHIEGFASGVKGILNEWGDIHILTTDNKVIRLKEKTLAERLNMLCQRDLYPTALRLASKSTMRENEIQKINYKYGDFLFSKSDYDNAIQQYTNAVASSEPSRVIRKFLGIQRITNLIQYLEELHRHPALVTTEHTTLLLNCYAKLKDVDKLENFIRLESGQQFDLNTVISLCRQAGYFGQAVVLAQRNSEYDTVMDILMEDMKNFGDGMKYLITLEPEIMHRNLMKWGRILLHEMPDDTTALLIGYFTGKYAPRIQIPETIATVSQPASSGFQSYAAYLQLPYLGNPLYASNPDPDTPDLVQAEPLVSRPYQPPLIRTAFSLFIDHPTEFVKFLEATMPKLTTSEDLPEIRSTLLEMYLHHANENSEQGGEAWHEKAKLMLKRDQESIDSSNVLLLSHLCGFQDGTTLVREDQRLFFDIFRSYTASKDTTGAMGAVKLYGAAEPQLYPAALAFLTSSPQILQEAGDQLVKVLEVIEKDGLMAPLQVVQILGKNGVATVRIIRKYLSETIEKERSEIQQDQNYINGYRRDTLARKKEIADLENKPVVFQPNRCSSCGTSLELPAVHFLCKHSFHQRCLNSPTEPLECPSCAPGNAAIKAIRQAQEDTADQHGLFEAAMEATERDRFNTITEFFSRGVMKSRAQLG